MNTFNIIIFDKNTRLFKSYVSTNQENSIFVSNDELSVTLSAEEWVPLFESKRLLRLKDDLSIEMLPEKPNYFCYWDIASNSWVENQDEKIRIMSGYVRDKRDTLLQELDTIITNPLRYASLSDIQKDELSQYRQNLLDVPQQTGFPLDVTWPIKPSFI